MWGLALRLPPLVYFIIAVLMVIVSVTTFLDHQKDEAVKAQARAGKRPEAVAIENFDRTRNVGLADEVTILGQLDADRVIDVSETKDGRETDHWTIAPLYPTDAEAPTAEAPAVFVQHGAITDKQLVALAVGPGKFGPILLLNGKMETQVNGPSQVRKALNGRVAVAPAAIYVDPFEEGRLKGLEASTSGRDIAIVALIVALVITGYGFYRRWDLRMAPERYV